MDRVLERARDSSRDPRLVSWCREIRSIIEDARRNNEREFSALEEAVAAFEECNPVPYAAPATSAVLNHQASVFAGIASLTLPMGLVDAPAVVADAPFAPSRDRVAE